MDDEVADLSPMPLRRVERHPAAPPPEGDVWPSSIPAVRQLLAEGLDLGRCTVLVGANGAGKSTIIEAIAESFGLGVEGGSTGALHATTRSESPLHAWLRLVRGPGGSRWGYFVRAETMHGLFTYLEETTLESFHRRSHGEAFLDLLGTKRYRGDGLFVWDEPEAGLSFDAQLQLVAGLGQIASRPGAQVLLATHSPVLAAVPGARLIELSEAGMRETSWDDLAVVAHYRRFLAAPERYLRHLLD